MIVFPCSPLSRPALGSRRWGKGPKAVTCPSCGGVSRDLEFCDRCNADLVPPPVLLPPATCPLDEGDLPLSREQLRHLGRPEASVLVHAGGCGWRLHWVPESLWPRWQSSIEQRL